jgi:hypothetical protein
MNLDSKKYPKSNLLTAYGQRGENHGTQNFHAVE